MQAPAFVGFFMKMSMYLATLLHLRKCRGHRRFWVHPINERHEQFGEFHRLCRELRSDEDIFFGYFHMSPALFDDLVQRTSHILWKEGCNFRKPLSTQERLAVCLQ